MEKLMERSREYLTKFADLLELLLAVLVSVIVIFVIVKSIPGFIDVLKHDSVSYEITEVLTDITSIVIGIEFIKLLLRPKMSTTIEVLVFLIARHMIVLETTSLDDLLSVISIVLLFALQKGIKNVNILPKKKNKKDN
ncbi:MAG: hypothetical protein K5851_02305 [Lachnospiraceae bacterium]|nr:hypothetical protein [Lachnospiraceae bacterium]